MVVDSAADERLDLLFHALADPTRRSILTVVLHGDQSVSELSRRFPTSFAAVQKHVTVLERAGLVVKQRRGREQRVTGDVRGLRTARQLLDQLESVWRMRIAAIDDVLDESPESPGGTDARDER
jgi:DNA-binding transcriptional ArsR family regulator